MQLIVKYFRKNMLLISFPPKKTSSLDTDIFLCLLFCEQCICLKPT